MKNRKLGDCEVPAVGLGCMGMTIAYGVFDDDLSIATIHRAMELNAAFLDTSNNYGRGANEELLARAIEGRRGDVILATKFGNIHLPDGSRAVCGKPDHVISACEASLGRLKTDVIDILYQHRVDPATPIEDTVGAMSRLVEQGKVRALGLSEAGPDTIRRAHATHPISALQSEYSLWTRDVEADILPLCRELGIGFVAYAPLGRGFLSATIRTPGDLIEGDRRHAHPRFSPENMEQNTAALLPVLEEVAAAKGATAAQVALAWLLAQGDDIVPIPGSKRRGHLEDNIAALDVSLNGEDLSALNDAFRPGAAAGPRYPEKQLAGVGL
ncbi:MAG: aldo/keto reductase [Proteobacteria bacterium]|nr:aldo/keto reductase [Pseudomonadota bacterium]